MGDVGSGYIISEGSKTKPVSSEWIHHQPVSSLSVPYMTARISRWQFTYTFQVTPGHKFIRLHFYPTLYPGFERSKSFFNVKAGPYTLLSNFSASLTADALGLQFFSKEFCVNVEENKPLVLNFIPSLDGTSGNQVYAFVNGIEIVSIPAGLYHTREGDPGVQVVGRKYTLPIDDNVALEMVQRLTVGGSSILPSEDTGMFREWFDDSNHLLESSVMPAITTMEIKYTNVATYIAPPKVYQTSWSKVLDEQGNKHSNFTWKLNVDLGFRYLIRFHFCELEYHINEIGHREFTIFIDNQMAEVSADLIRWSGGNGVALYKDYVMTMEGERLEGKRDLLITLCPCMNNNFGGISEHNDAILKGLEVFKMSNIDNNLAGANPLPLASVLTPGNRNPHKFSCATYVIVLLIFLNIVTYLLRILGEKIGEGNISSTEFEGLCQEFTLAEIQLITNNFSDEMVIGRGGFGNVYKGSINNGVTTVAIKRLNPQSKQGANEFWTEIKMLSKFRHAHLVSLIGYCDESNEKVLVYEYMEHGTFADHLYKNHGKDDANYCHLSWEQRLRICVGAARGLDYLHTGTQNGVIHRDVKTTNILLDKNWEAKISDFGLCRTGTSRFDTHISTNHVKGTFGFLDPEYFYSNRLTKKSDVFSFGVVLLEALCGRPAVDTSLEEEQHSLAIWAQQCIKEEKLDQIIDPRLRDQISSGCLKLIAEVAQRCLQHGSKARPTMSEVVVSLEGALALQDKFGDSSIENEDKNVYRGVVDDDLSEDTILSFSNLTQDHDIIPQGKKRSKGMFRKLFQLQIALSSKGMDILRRKGKYNDSKGKQVSCGTDTQPLRCFSIVEIQAATENFHKDLVIGEGDCSQIYKGHTDHGTREVAVRCLKVRATDVLKIRIQAQYQFSHRHILSLIGYCVNDRKLILVEDYMSNGSLVDHLYGKGTGYDPLPWKKRLEICIGAAQGLWYLHSCAEHHNIHGNFKLTKILLDKDWVAKISPWGAEGYGYNTRNSRFLVSNIGYFANNIQLKQKSDVYSFGMVLLEVLCARISYEYSLHQAKKPLICWFKDCVQRKRMDEFIDPYLNGRIAPECLREFIKITWNCLLDQKLKRPSMDDVVGSLQSAFQLQQNWASSENAHDAFCATSAHDCNNIFSYNSAFGIMNTAPSCLLANLAAICKGPAPSQASTHLCEPAKSTTKDGNSTSENVADSSFKAFRNWQISDSPNLRIFAFGELKAATQNFRRDNVLGEGGFGMVYKGWLDECKVMNAEESNRLTVAVKRRNADGLQGLTEWKSEVDILGRLSHPNLVKLLGCCSEDTELLLVYEFMPKGSLENHLCGRDSCVQPLPWNVRVKILLGAAQGLAFLHTLDEPFIYRDFKTSNILLDEFYNAKLADFGLAKRAPPSCESHVTTRVMGTYGYAAPEFVATGHLYVKSDVYGFGVVLTEMLTGLRAINRDRPQEQQNLVEWAKPYLFGKRKLKKIMDNRLECKYPSVAALQLADLAAKCLSPEPKMRPSMMEVVKILLRVAEVE
ncbi:Non-specific serine/threonine protein kinase [Bertholletia excelsa]